MTYGLPPHIGFAAIDVRGIVLDTAADRYHLMAPRLTRCLLDLSQGNPAPDRDALQALITMGFAAEGGEGATVNMRAPPTAVCSAIDDPVDGSEDLTVMQMARVMLRVLGGERHSLADRIDQARVFRARRPQIDDQYAAARLARGFSQRRRLLPVRQICLRDCFALDHVLSRKGLASSLVLGVRLDPFAAHSWVQCGDVLLTADSLDAVREYTPAFII